MRKLRNLFLMTLLVAALTPTGSLKAQEPASWGEDLVFHTFSIAAVDPRTGESGVAVTTRVPCVGNGVPWVRSGVGAVATQASTRVAYGPELLEMIMAKRLSVAPAQRDVLPSREWPITMTRFASTCLSVST